MQTGAPSVKRAVTTAELLYFDAGHDEYADAIIKTFSTGSTRG